MKPKQIWANFIVKDAQRTRKFYTELGFVSNGTHEAPKLASFFFGDDKFVIHFFEEGSIIEKYLSSGTTRSEIMFSLSAETENETKEWADAVLKAGGTIFQKLERDKDGYYGFGFADPDGHKFNVLLMDMTL